MKVMLKGLTKDSLCKIKKINASLPEDEQFELKEKKDCKKNNKNCKRKKINSSVQDSKEFESKKNKECKRKNKECKRK
ncbi:MAG: hypothetical protein GXZ15_06090 [Campylobacter sp.]|nr:hypothetical protein [Campylobacter sp.]